jgi:hypothetical protein
MLTGYVEMWETRDLTKYIWAEPVGSRYKALVCSLIRHVANEYPRYALTIDISSPNLVMNTGNRGLIHDVDRVCGDVGDT